jgi:NADH:ubiquinone oxidoreductase subunit H
MGRRLLYPQCIFVGMNACVFSLVYILFSLVPLIVAIAIFTLAERKVMAAIQRRRGPNIVGF